MAFLELVTKRRSIRNYSSMPVSREIVDRCIEAARLAPSACNSQPWSFIVIDDKELKDRITTAAFSEPYSINNFAKKASVLVVVITERSSYIACMGGYLRGLKYSLIDIGIACEHFILQAEEDGVGTCWLGWFNERAVKKILGIPRRHKIDVMISMGYPERGEIRHRGRKSLSEIRKFNKG